ncbi:hypothetical protein Mapa_017045 [Marchantia paleacea]|nr:hypothetical protein Mapa_017045 [Marchantia paleacea]
MAATMYKTLAGRTLIFFSIFLMLLVHPLAVASARAPQSGEIPINAGSILERRSLVSWWANLNGCKDCGDCCKTTMHVIATGDCCSKCC